MTKFWLIAWYEYKRNVFKKSFILALLSVPLMIALNVGVGFVMESVDNDAAPIGYVDYAGLLEDPIPAPEIARRKSVSFIPYTTKDAALEALQAKTIQAYYVISADYYETRQVDLVFSKKPSDNATWMFHDFMQINLLRDQPPEIAQRAAAGTDVVRQSANGNRTVPVGGPTMGLLLPLFIGLAFLILLLMSSGYLMQAIASEKENRTMEVLATSVSPMQMIGGKTIGIIGIGLTQLVVWTLVLILALFIADQLDIAWVQNPMVDWSSVLATLIIAIPAYVLACAVMLAIGAAATSLQEAQSLTGLLILPHVMIPAYLAWALVKQPNGPLAIGLTLAPFTALLTTSFRNMFTVVPWWQVAASATIQTLCAVGGIWLASRAFRLGMLRYGQRLRWREILKARPQ
jgi:ABC-2 type transport system permease protein